jgi:hypothetical protein
LPSTSAHGVEKGATSDRPAAVARCEHAGDAGRAVAARDVDAGSFWFARVLQVDVGDSPCSSEVADVGAVASAFLIAASTLIARGDGRLSLGVNASSRSRAGSDS